MMLTRTLCTMTLALLVVLMSAAHTHADAAEDVRINVEVAAKFAQTTGEGSILLYDEVGISHDAVRLADVARLTGPGAEMLGQTILARFDDKTDTLVLRNQQIRQQLVGMGVNWGTLSLRGYATCRVHRLGREPAPVAEPEHPEPTLANPAQAVDVHSPMTVRQRIEQLVADMADFDPRELSVVFNERDAVLLDRSAVGSRFEFEPGAVVVPGRLPIIVREYRGDVVVETTRLHVDAIRRVDAVVVRESVQRGQMLTERDLTMQRVHLTSPGEPATALSEAVGMTPRGALRPGSVVYVNQLQRPVAVRRNELVTVQAFAGGMTIRTVGRALEDGAQGDIITIRNERSRETFFAQIAGPRLVHVQAEGTFSSQASTATSGR